ncbi:MAG: hypothetical protein JXA37_08450 [Chloroflexia bacterium]|nr:hypothetical protein [Chloroflexia bacterium]
MLKRNALIILAVVVMAALLSNCTPLDTGTSYQGQLTDPAGAPVPNGTYEMVFRLYGEVDDAVGTELWSETQNVAVNDGLFNVSLGEVNPIPVSTFSQQLWLGVAVDGDEEMTPRQELQGAPYAMSLSPGAGMQGSINMSDEFPGMLNIQNVGDGYGVAINHWGAAGLTINGALDPTAADPIVLGQYGFQVESVLHGGVITATDGLGLNAISAAGPSNAWWGIRGEGFADDGGDGVFGWGHGSNNNATGLTGRAESGYGVYVFTGGAGQYGGYFADPIYVNGGCTGCSLRYTARNTSEIPLQPGDAVAATGVEPETEGLQSPVMRVARATPGQTVLGVVVGRTTMTMAEAGLDDVQPGAQFGPVNGTAAPGDYLVIVVQGPAQVRAAEAGIAAGDMVYLAAEGVSNATSGAAIGMALESVDSEGLVWVLVGFH